MYLCEGACGVSVSVVSICVTVLECGVEWSVRVRKRPLEWQRGG